MADQPKTLEPNPKKRKRRRGLFPRLSLPKVLELPDTIYQLGHGEPVRRRTVFDKLEKSPDSGASRLLVSTSNGGYGLTTGGYTAEYLGITELGQQLVTAKSQQGKNVIAQRLLLENDIFNSFVSYFNDRPAPIDEVAVDYLRNNHDLPEVDAKACWSVFQEHIYEFGFVQELSGKEILLHGIKPQPLEDALTDQDTTPNTIEESAIATVSPQITDSLRSKKPQSSSAQINPQITFNIQVVLPENASAETYDDIFKSIATHLLRRDEE